MPIVAGACGFLLIVGIIGTALALNGGSEGTQTSGTGGATGGSLDSAPTFTMQVEDSQLVYTIDYPNYQEGDRYLVKAALSEDVIDKATAYGVSEIDTTTGTGTFSQEFGSASRQCARVRVQRGEALGVGATQLTLGFPGHDGALPGSIQCDRFGYRVFNSCTGAVSGRVEQGVVSQG